MQSFDKIPQPLYKYRVWEEPCAERQYSRRILTDNEIYFPSADQFNDPFDCSLPHKYKRESLNPQNIYLKCYEVYKEKYPHKSEVEIHSFCNKVTSNFDYENYWKASHNDLKEENYKTFGGLSLTSNKENLLMWSHYADSHRGFCVGLDKHLLFNSLNNGQIGPVLYDNEFPEIEIFENPNLSVIKITMTKSKHWISEDEYRIVKHGAREIVKIPNEAILEIILGCKMLQQHKEAIYSLAKEKFPNARIYEARLSTEHFRLDFI